VTTEILNGCGKELKFTVQYTATTITPPFVSTVGVSRKTIITTQNATSW